MTELIERLRQAAKEGSEYAERIKVKCKIDGCVCRPFKNTDYCFTHYMQAKRAEIVKEAGGHNLESYRVHKLRHQTTRGMV